MANKTGKITAAPAAAAGGSEDASLPDPTQTARLFLCGCIVLALVVAIVADRLDWATRAFAPAQDPAANFALFSGFYVAAQVIERLMELVSPLLPLWGLPAGFSTDPKVRAVQVKADRAKAALGVATVAGVVASAGLGLYFLTAIGMHVSRMVDIAVTGLVIGAGTKPLHDLITNLQNKNTPSSGTTTSA
jgi:hypothetical protein